MLSSYDLTIVVDLNKPVVVFPVRAGTHPDQQRNLTMNRSDKRRERDYGTDALRQGLQPSSSRTAASAPTCFLLSIELGPPISRLQRSEALDQCAGPHRSLHLVCRPQLARRPAAVTAGARRSLWQRRSSLVVEAMCAQAWRCNGHLISVTA